MKNNLNIVCIIPARGGSKGIPKKNLLNIGGKPLVAWSIEQSKNSKYIKDKVFVSSDCNEILDVSKSYGAKVILRPDGISGDIASSEEALLHAILEIEKLYSKIDLVVFLQATSPLRKSDDIDNAIKQFINSKSDTLLSVYPIEDFFIWSKENNSYKSDNFNYKKRKRRQDIDVKYLENGSIYIFKPEYIIHENNRLGGKIDIYEMDKIHSLQIDNHDEVELVDYFLRKHYV